jgi:hypothetical protein
MPTQRLAILAWFLVNSVHAIAADVGIKFQSTGQQTTLLELYTSEGCSSCPPAETWLSRLVDSPQLWRDVVPVAFHVDYWDYLGWRDPWGLEQFSDRQRKYGAVWQSRTIYTPEFVRNGKEWRNWSGRDVPHSPATQIGVVSASSTDTNNWLVRFQPTANTRVGYEASMVLLVSNVKSKVTAGENEGRTLQHDFVALTFAKAPMPAQNEAGECRLRLPIPAKFTSGRLAVAVWVTEQGQLTPLQATGGWLTRR